MSRHGWSPLAIALALSACAAEPPCPAADLAPLPREPAFTVVLSDYASSAIAVLDAEGAVITEAWLDSGTGATGLRAGIGGDVVAVGRDPRGRIALLERYGVDLLTLLDPDGSEEPLQIDVRGDGGAYSGHSPNPQDVLFDGSSAWVTRHNPALDPAVPELAHGDDLVRVELDASPDGAAELVERFDLEADVQLEGRTIYGRPSAIVRAGDVFVIGLARTSLDFRTSGPGAIVTFDPALGRRVALESLEGLSDCGQVAAIPGERARVMVLCSGDAFADEDTRRAEAGIVGLAIAEDGSIEIERAWRAADHATAPSPSSGLLPLDAARAIAVADPRGGDGVSGSDSLVLVDLETGEARTLLETERPFTLGQGALDARGAFALIPDAGLRALRRLELGAGSPRESEPIPLPTCRTLPPRQVSRL